MIKLEIESRLVVARANNYKGVRLLGGNGTVLNLDCDGEYMNLHTE